jgi:hypothetical protein
MFHQQIIKNILIYSFNDRLHDEINGILFSGKMIHLYYDSWGSSILTENLTMVSNVSNHHHSYSTCFLNAQHHISHIHLSHSCVKKAGLVRKTISPIFIFRKVLKEMISWSHTNIYLCNTQSYSLWR